MTSQVVSLVYFLAAKKPRFEHVIAVDAKFTLFERAWCVAELAEGSLRGVKQHLLVRSRSSLERNARKVWNLRIEDMKASRIEDIKGILDRIPDTAAFNRKLRVTIWDKNVGLMEVWKGLDTTEQMSQIGRLARWQHFCGRKDMEFVKEFWDNWEPKGA